MEAELGARLGSVHINLIHLILSHVPWLIRLRCVGLTCRRLCIETYLSVRMRVRRADALTKRRTLPLIVRSLPPEIVRELTFKLGHWHGDIPSYAESSSSVIAVVSHHRPGENLLEQPHVLPWDALENGEVLELVLEEKGAIEHWQLPHAQDVGVGAFVGVHQTLFWSRIARAIAPVTSQWGWNVGCKAAAVATKGAAAVAGAAAIPLAVAGTGAAVGVAVLTHVPKKKKKKRAFQSQPSILTQITAALQQQEKEQENASSQIQKVHAGTLNVHGFMDERRKPNVAALCDSLAQGVHLDILALQEVNPSFKLQGHRLALHYMAGRLGLPYICNHGKVAILSRWPVLYASVLTRELGGILQCEVGTMGSLILPEMRARRDFWHRAVSVRVQPEWLQEGFDVCCLHLDHVNEQTRLKQLSTVLSMMEFSHRVRRAQLVLGDFNALTEADYSTRDWSIVAEVREKNRWEAPVSLVTDRMRDEGYVDTWASVCGTGSRTTCRFDTRIDYVYVHHHALEHDWKTSGAHHVKMSATDHDLVVAEFEVEAQAEEGSFSAIASDVSVCNTTICGDVITIQVKTNEGCTTLSVSPDALVTTLCEYMGMGDGMELTQLLLGGEPCDLHGTFRENGIEDAATVTALVQVSIEHLVMEMEAYLEEACTAVEVSVAYRGEGQQNSVEIKGQRAYSPVLERCGLLEIVQACKDRGEPIRSLTVQRIAMTGAFQRQLLQAAISPQLETLKWGFSSFGNVEVELLAVAMESRQLPALRSLDLVKNNGIKVSEAERLLEGLAYCDAIAHSGCTIVL